MLAEEERSAFSLEHVDRLSDGIERLTSSSIDVVLLDLGLPDSQGLGTFTKLQAAAPKKPILILTGYADDVVALEAVRRGAQDYLIKGKIDGSLLIRAVGYAVERKKAEEALKKGEQRVRQLFDSTTETFEIIELEYDEHGKAIDFYFREVNPAFEQLVDKTREQLVDKRARDLLNIENNRIQEYSKVANTGKPGFREAYVAGLDKYFEIYAWKVGENQVAIIGTDITERKKAEEQLKETEKFTAIGRTAAMVGHDLRNPLQAVVALVCLTEEHLKGMSCAPAEKREIARLLNQINDQTFYMNKIVSDLQDYAGPVKLSLAKTDLCQLISEALSVSKIPANIAVSTRVPKNLSKVSIDSVIMKRALTNLITNAIQAMPDGGSLTVSASRKKNPHTLIVDVRDTGAGIPKSDRPRIFTPLFTTKSKGQGLGLAVCKRLVEAHQGTITFRTRKDKGTVFSIRIPLERNR